MRASDATELFQRFRDHPELTWTHNNTGCESRADLMAEIADELGLEPTKIWIRTGPGSGEPFGIYLNESRTESSYCKYHVAVVIDDLVYDPAFFKSPVSRETWVERLNWRNKEYQASAQVIESEWRYFYDPQSDMSSRESALETRTDILTMSRNLDDPTILFGVMAKARGDWVDDVARTDPESFEKIREDGVYGPFGIWFRGGELHGDLEKWLREHPMYFGLQSKDILDAIDFSDRLAALEVRKYCWRHVYDLFKILKRRRDELRDGGDPQSLFYKSMFKDDSDDAGERIASKAMWFNRGSQDWWERFGIDYCV